MAKVIVKFKNPNEQNRGVKTTFIIAGITSAVFIFSLLFILIKFIGWTQPQPTYNRGVLKGVSYENVLYDPSQSDQFDIFVETKKTKSGYAFRGQKDVKFLEFSITPKVTGKLSKIVFSLSGFSHPKDISGMQLYMDEKFLGERPLYLGEAIFDGLNIQLDAGNKTDFKLFGDVSDVASAGDRLQIGIFDIENVKFRGKMGENLLIGGNFPILGDYVSVIGSMF